MQDTRLVPSCDCMPCSAACFPIGRGIDAHHRENRGARVLAMLRLICVLHAMSATSAKPEHEDYSAMLQTAIRNASTPSSSWPSSSNPANPPSPAPVVRVWDRTGEVTRFRADSWKQADTLLQQALQSHGLLAEGEKCVSMRAKTALEPCGYRRKEGAIQCLEDGDQSLPKHDAVLELEFDLEAMLNDDVVHFVRDLKLPAKDWSRVLSNLRSNGIVQLDDFVNHDVAQLLEGVDGVLPNLLRKKLEDVEKKAKAKLAGGAEAGPLCHPQASLPMSVSPRKKSECNTVNPKP